MWAAMKGHYLIVILLIEYEANINLRTEAGILLRIMSVS